MFGTMIKVSLVVSLALDSMWSFGRLFSLLASNVFVFGLAGRPSGRVAMAHCTPGQVGKTASHLAVAAAKQLHSRKLYCEPFAESAKTLPRNANKWGKMGYLGTVVLGAVLPDPGESVRPRKHW